MAWRVSIAFLGLLCFGLLALAQNTQPPIPVSQLDPGTLGQPGFRFAGGVPPVVNLMPHADGARAGHLWIGNTGRSLRIAGEVDGNAPEWPKNQASILLKDHVEVWLAGATDVELPPIGWGDQFGLHELDSANGCSEIASTPNPSSKDTADHEKCRAWFVAQQKYRPLFKRLFVRQWLSRLRGTKSRFLAAASLNAR